MMTCWRFEAGALLGVTVVAVVVSAAAMGSPPPGGNRLKWEMSPYLLRHADDPVDWYPWDPEAFAAAREQDKPIFLSIGDASCYWCHVMERESFEDAATAAVLNADFIAIMVDREERPDVDAIYTAAVKAMTASGGWPLSVFLDPRSLEPFAGGTYDPAQPRGGTPSFRQVLQSVTEQWKTDRQGVASRAADVAGQVRVALSSATQSVPVGREQVDEAVSSILEGYDPVNGGFQRGAPKFARPAQLALLLDAARSDAVAREAVLHTLDRMAIGGMYDQVAGGFHRSSTDEQWLVPHFEKMLYDNAQLARVYTRAYQLTGDPFYAHIARETLEYLLRETYGRYGAFFGAQDAEADGREGASYVWTSEQVLEALTLVGLEQDVGFALEVYGLNDGPNFRDPRHPEDEPANVLHLADRPEAVAARMGMTGTAFDTRLAGVKQALLSMRSERGDPLIDDKVITEWNGLMMVTLVEAAQAFGEPRYRQAAEKTGLFLLGRVRTHDGWLARSWRADIGQIRAFSGDYAQYIAGLIALHRVSGAAVSKWLINAETYAEEAKGLFLDPATGAFYDTRKDQPDLFVRPRTMADRVMPCPTSTMILNLLDLYEITGEDRYRDDAEAMIKGLGGRLKEDPASLPVAAMAVQRFAERGTARPVQPAARAPAAKSASPVVAAGTGPLVARVSRAAITVGPGSPGRFEVTLDIGDGYHVTAHDPGSPLLSGLQLRLIGPGLELSADYPAGEAFRTAGFGQAIRVYTGVVTIPVTITQKAVWKGAPRLVLTYQVCTDAACLKPERTVLTLRVDAGR